MHAAANRIQTHKTDIAAGLVLVLAGLWHWVGRPESVVNLHPFRQTQTLWPIREFMEDGWSLATPMPVLGPPWNIPFEFPLFQILAATLGTLTGIEAEPAARLVSLTFFLLAGLALLYIVRAWFSSLAGLVTTALFVLSPFANQWSAATLIEFVPVALILLAVAVLVWCQRSGRNLWIGVMLAAGLSTLAAMVKITTFIPWVPVIFVALGVAMGGIRQHRVALGLAAIFLPVGVGTLVWTRFADGVKGQSELTIWLTSGNLPDWNLGTLSQRLVVDNTATILDRMSSLGAPVAVWGVAIVVAGVATRWTWRFVTLALVPLVGFVVFFNLYIVHDYYLAAISPSYAAIVGIAVAAIVDRITDSRARTGFVVVIIPGLLASSLLSGEGRRLAEVWRTPSVIPPLSTSIAEVTDQDDVILMLGCDWDPTVLYYANRRGVSVPASWEGPLPKASLDVVTHVAACEGLYGPGSRIPGGFVPDSWVIDPVNPGVWRIESK